MKKKMYRISLFENSNLLADTLAILAAKSNGYPKKHTLTDLNHVAQSEIILYPTANKNTTCELLDNNTLHLDRKIGDEYKTVLIIEQVEIWEIETPEITQQEAKDLLEEITGVPTLDRQGGVVGQFRCS